MESRKSASYTYEHFIPCPNRLRPLLLACKDKASISKTHALMHLTGLFMHGSSNGGLIASYANIGDIKSARNVFDVLPQRGVGAWNAMIIAYSRIEYPVEVLNLYRQMILEGVRPDSSTFTVALKACTRLLDLKTGEEIWCRAMDCGFEFDVFVGSSILNLYAKCGKMDEAIVVFDRMPRRDLVCWTTMIRGFAQSGRPIEAVDMYRRMQKEGMEGDGVVMVPVGAMPESVGGDYCLFGDRLWDDHIAVLLIHELGHLIRKPQKGIYPYGGSGSADHAHVTSQML